MSFLKDEFKVHPVLITYEIYKFDLYLDFVWKHLDPPLQQQLLRG